MQVLEKQNMKSPALIVFDLDDTLYQERDFISSGHRALARVLAEASGADSEELFALINGRHPRGIEAAIEFLAGKGCKVPYTVDELVEIYRSHRPDIHLSPDVEETLAELKRQGHRLALITDGSSRHQRAKFDALGLDRYIAPDAVFVSEETGGDKHTPASFILAEKLLQGRRFYIGDNPEKDFIYPNMRGWTSVMLLDKDGRNVFPQNPELFPAINRPALAISEFKKIPDIL